MILISNRTTTMSFLGVGEKVIPHLEKKIGNNCLFFYRTNQKIVIYITNILCNHIFKLWPLLSPQIYFDQKQQYLTTELVTVLNN